MEGRATDSRPYEEMLGTGEGRWQVAGEKTAGRQLFGAVYWGTMNRYTFL